MTARRRASRGAGLPFIAVAIALSLAGCASNVGPKTVGPARFDYNQALSSSWNEQILLNLVRLRYRDTPVFLEVGTVLAQYSVTGAGSLGVDITDGPVDDDIYGIRGAVEFSESPTITYTPLQGEEFVRRLLTPVSPATVLLLSQAGWSIERLMLCCVNRLNGLPNAPSAAGPTPDYTPKYGEFHRLARLLRELQVAGYFSFRVDRTDGEEKFLVEVIPSDDPEVDAMAAEVADILGVERGQGTYRLVEEGAVEAGDLVMSGRSLLGMFFYLSQAVTVPAAHIEAGWVTRTRRPDGSDFDWDELTGRLFRVANSTQRPSGAFTAVPYRGHWFYLDDTDLNSKTTFGLLTLLFSLQASGGEGASPLLTVATGR
ncbi:MAG: hypothetical protein ACRD2Z_00280 [Thermoanaerobaculia bacterium]